MSRPRWKVTVRDENGSVKEYVVWRQQRAFRLVERAVNRGCRADVKPLPPVSRDRNRYVYRHPRRCAA
jgi:hypothetical protein